MRQFVFAVRDNATNGFLPPFFVPHKGLAERMFRDTVNNADPQNLIHKHPEDYALYELGEFDDQTGVFTNIKTPQQLLHGIKCLHDPN